MRRQSRTLVHDNIYFFKQKTAYEMRISDWSSDVCSSDLLPQEYANAISTARRRAAASLQYLQSSERLLIDEPDLSHLRYAMALIFSRALNVNDRMMLLPVVDLMNHRPASMGACRMSHDSQGRLTIVAKQDLAVVQALGLCYGDKSLPK